MSNAERVIVVGADAAGMSAAHQALRTARTTGRDIDVVVLEKTQDTSYSACGIPYVLAGLVGSTDELSARTADKHRAMGVDLRLGATATGLDMATRTVTSVTDDGRESHLPFDKLVLATGADAIVPPWARDSDDHLITGVLTVKNLEDARSWLDLLVGREATARPRGAVVVGGGYIGVEMAEAFLARGLATTLITRGAVMSTLDPLMSERVTAALEAAGIRVVTDTTVIELDTHHGTVRAVTTAAGDTYPADVVALGIGLRPASALGAGAGLAIGGHGGYLPDDQQRIGDGVWAAGDCCEVLDRMRGKSVFSPLGTHANKQGRVCGYNIAGEHRTFAGILGTAITRFSHGDTHLEIARTGLSTTDALAMGFEAESLTTEGGTASGYMAERAPIAANIIADRRTRRLLGVQVVGGAQAGKRIDTAAAALWGEMAIDDLAEMDLSYAPPFATVWEALQLAARRLADRL
ncbi:FAD-dependent oxidoreductase [Mycobacterium sp. AT1]|uniref:FAD-dependent oxidoreductase n=1 Tax=Mycobacterium sp. AT1 TaxID=1961706 RepID=UPI0009AC8638|nr:FAD-dependent oxidoreductase [Mycobacterium sp. AT1]OPX05306.1 CoA-disulfide reductase [Mycobacterium sp. AT1]